MLDPVTMKRAILVSILPYTALLVVVRQDAGGTERAELRALTRALSWAERLRIGTWAPSL